MFRNFFLVRIVSLLANMQPLCAAALSVESVLSPVGQRGSEFTLKLIGAGFDDAEEVLFYRPGITCTALKVTSENELTLTLNAAADCPSAKRTDPHCERRVFSANLFRQTRLC